MNSKNIISTDATTLYLKDILKNYDPYNFENATTKYRKPSYQRALGKPVKWNQSLVESILLGRSVGAVVMSKWTKIKMNDVGDPYYVEYYNIEDGGTRLGALLKFMNKDFKVTLKQGLTKTQYDYSNQYIANKFDSYKLPIVMIEKSSSRIKDSKYFTALCENFSLLQEGTSLTPSDRYCAIVSDPSEHFKGSPIVDFTIKMIIENTNFDTYMRIVQVGPRDKNRKKLATAVAIVSGMMFGPSNANESYYDHAPNIFKDLSPINLENYKHISNLIFSTIRKCSELYPKWTNEKFTTYFSKTKLFTGLMIADIYDKYPHTPASSSNPELYTPIVLNLDWRTFSNDFMSRWTSLINCYRKQISSGGKSVADKWLESGPYRSLGDGQKRNCKCKDLITRMNKVKEWIAVPGSSVGAHSSATSVVSFFAAEEEGGDDSESDSS
jgi:hypothetical protein|tara:strand:- start:34 stop:1350 length:1317 start_codon:yes stop_codon:yes gene_type:complete